jgi:hypothetical protein
MDAPRPHGGVEELRQLRAELDEVGRGFVPDPHEALKDWAEGWIEALSALTRPGEQHRFGMKPDGAGSWGVYDSHTGALVAVGLSSEEAAHQTTVRNVQPSSPPVEEEGR